MSNGSVPFLDLVSPHVEMEEELVALFRSCLRSAAFVGGKPVEGFEEAFAAFCGVEQCVGVGSGTDALRFALSASGVSVGDCVLTSPNTFIATTEAISQIGACPEFVDVDRDTYNIDPRKLREHIERECDRDIKSGRPISRRTGRIITSIVPIHLYGQMADMDPIMSLAREYNLIVVEDACQAHGAEYYSREQSRWQKAGSVGEAAAFSFYPGKNLGACGEAGAITTNDGEAARTARKLRDHGQAEKYYHDIEGYNGRLDTIQAGILKLKLDRLAEWNSLRREKAEVYRCLLADIEGLTLPVEHSWSRAVYHLYVVRVKERMSVQDGMRQQGVGTGIHYPIPLHLQKAYQHLRYRKGDFPVAEQVSSEIISLPMYPQLTLHSQEKIAGAVKASLAVPSRASREVVHTP
jgi:dTDP-4-amino-4,6-dideoxygalactose transaminase